QYGFFRQQEVLYREHGLFHFASVLHAGQQNLAGSEVDDHAAIAVGAVPLFVAHEVGCVQDLPGRLVLRVPLFGADEQAAAEQVVPRSLCGDFHRQVMIAVGANVQVGNELVAVSNEFGYAVPQSVELVGREGAVDRTPVDLLAGAGLVHDEAVSGGAAGAGAGLGDERAIGSQLAFATLDGFFYQEGAAHIGVNNRSSARCGCHSSYVLTNGLWPIISINKSETVANVALVAAPVQRRTEFEARIMPK